MSPYPHRLIPRIPWLLPDRLWSEFVRCLPTFPLGMGPNAPWRRGTKTRILDWIGNLKRLHRMAGRRARIARSVGLSW